MADLRYLRANGTRFAYFEEGEGPLVLLLHGFPDTAHSWSFTASRLADAGFRVVSPFARGFAPSAIPADGRYDVETLGRDVVAQIEALGAERAIVIGHDWGAFASYEAATAAPSRVARLVTLAIPHPRSIVPRPRSVLGARHVVRLQFPDAEALLARDGFAYLDELVRRWSPSWNPSPGETARAKECLAHPASRHAAVEYYRALRRVRTGALRRPIAVPTIAFAGTDDPIFLPRDFEPARRWFTSEYEVVAMPGGHFLHREHPERFCAELLPRLRGIA